MTSEALQDLRHACSGAVRTGGPSRFVRMVKHRFVELVRSRRKRHTIRPVPKRVPRVGDLLALREWSGRPYRSPQLHVLDTVIIDVGVVRIQTDGVAMTAPNGSLLRAAGAQGLWLDGVDADRFARDDGFQDWSEMRDWFEREHALPFDGIIIYWE